MIKLLNLILTIFIICACFFTHFNMPKLALIMSILATIDGVAIIIVYFYYLFKNPNLLR